MIVELAREPQKKIFQLNKKRENSIVGFEFETLLEYQFKINSLCQFPFLLYRVLRVFPRAGDILQNVTNFTISETLKAFYCTNIRN